MCLDKGTTKIASCFQQQIQKLICKLPGVLQCSVVCIKDEVIKEIHILSTIDKNIKQLVRDVQSAITAAFGIQVDYKVISIAQINEHEIKHARIRIDSINVKNIDNFIEAHVTLILEGIKYEGRCIKVKSKNNKFKAVAEAAIMALEAYMDNKGVFYLEGLERITVAAREIFVIMIGISIDNKEELLVGNSIITTAEDESVVKAVLSAINRRINFIF